MKKVIIIPIVVGSLFIVLLAVVLAVQWPSLLEKYPVNRRPVTPNINTDAESTIGTKTWGSIEDTKNGYKVLNPDHRFYNLGYDSPAKDLLQLSSVQSSLPEFPLEFKSVLSIRGYLPDTYYADSTRPTTVDEFISQMSEHERIDSLTKYISAQGVTFDIFRRLPSLDGDSGGPTYYALTGAAKRIYTIDMYGSNTDKIPADLYALLDHFIILDNE